MESEQGTCEICKYENVGLLRTVFKYNIKCECHSSNHFDIVRHCKNCIPFMPKQTTVTLKTDDDLLWKDKEVRE